MLSDSITKRKIEDRHEKMYKEPDEPEEPEYDGDNVQMNADHHTYGEQSIIDNSENVNKNCDQISQRHVIPCNKRIAWWKKILQSLTKAQPAEMINLDE